MRVKSGKLDRVIIPSDVRQIGDDSISFVWAGKDERKPGEKEKSDKYLVNVGELCIAEGVEKIGRIQLRNYRSINVPTSLTSAGLTGSGPYTFVRPRREPGMTNDDYLNLIKESEKIAVHLDEGCKSNSYWVTIANSLQADHNKSTNDNDPAIGLKASYILMELDYRGSLRDKKDTKISQMLDVMGTEEVISMASTGAENVTPFTMEELLKR